MAASDDPSVGQLNSRDDSSWAQLEISPNVVGSVRYANFRVNIYEHARNNNNKQTHRCDIENKKYYYTPIAMLDSQSADSSYNNVTNRPEMTFSIELWNDQIEKTVTDWVQRKFGDSSSVYENQIQVIPFEKLILTSSSSSTEEQHNYHLDNSWISYQQQMRIKFKFICYKLDDCHQLAQQMRLNPQQFSHLQLQFSMASVKSQTRQTKIRIGNIVTGDLASKLLQRMPEVDFVLLKAEDEKRLISESATNIVIETFDDSDVVAPNSQAQISNQLKEMLISSRTIIKEQSDEMWDSVFWNDDNYRPDKTTNFWNEIYNKMNKQNQSALANAFKAGGDAGIKLKLYKSIAFGIGGGGYSDNSSSVEALDRLYEESKNSVQWNGEKFIPKPLTLAKFNMAKLQDNQTLFDRSIRLTYATAVLSVTINIPEYGSSSATNASSNALLNEIQLQLQGTF